MRMINIDRPWWYRIELISSRIIKVIIYIIQFIWEKLIWAFLIWIGKGVKKRIEEVFSSFFTALGNAIGDKIGVIIAIFLIVTVALLWQANEYSLNKTFSVEGVKTMWETVK